MNKLLIVDDSVTNLESLNLYFSTVGCYDVTLAFSGRIAEKAMLEKTFDFMIFDYLISDINGLDLIRWTRSRGIDTPILVLSGASLAELTELVADAVRDEDLGPVAVMSKGGHPSRVLAAMEDLRKGV